MDSTYSLKFRNITIKQLVPLKLRNQFGEPINFDAIENYVNQSPFHLGSQYLIEGAIERVINYGIAFGIQIEYPDDVHSAAEIRFERWEGRVEPRIGIENFVEIDVLNAVNWLIESGGYVTKPPAYRVPDPYSRWVPISMPPERFRSEYLQHGNLDRFDNTWSSDVDNPDSDFWGYHNDAFDRDEEQRLREEEAERQLDDRPVVERIPMSQLHRLGVPIAKFHWGKWPEMARRLKGTYRTVISLSQTFRLVIAERRIHFGYGYSIQWSLKTTPRKGVTPKITKQIFGALEKFVAHFHFDHPEFPKKLVEFRDQSTARLVVWLFGYAGNEKDPYGSLDQGDVFRHQDADKVIGFVNDPRPLSKYEGRNDLGPIE